MALSDRGDEQVIESIVVVVTDRDSKSEHLDRKAGLARDVSKGPVVIVVIQLQRSDSLVMAGEILAVHQQNVRPAVVVVINERAARPHSFGQILLSERAIVVDEANARLRSDVAESDVLLSMA